MTNGVDAENAVEVFKRKMDHWVAGKEGDPEVLSWLAENPPPPRWNRNPLVWAYFHASPALLRKWGRYTADEAESAEAAKAELRPIPAEARTALQPIASEAPAIPQEEEEQVTAEPVERLSWFGCAREGEPPVPLIKMPGSKRWLCPALQDNVPQYLASSGGRFVEPFAGSAAVALSLGAKGCRLLVADASEELMGILAAARDRPRDYFAALGLWVERGYDQEHYLTARGFEPTGSFSRAVRALYLARLAFNGLWRVNAKGRFNVPYGHSDTRSFPSLAAVLAVSEALMNAEIYCEDFRKIFLLVQPNDVVYLDPPYVGTFTAYTAAGFNLADAQELAECARNAALRGVAVIASSPADPKIAEGYAWAHSADVGRRHIVAAKAADRVVYPEAIYTNRPDLVALNKLRGHDALENEAASRGDEEATDGGVPEESE